jgi:hypothetical protein
MTSLIPIFLLGTLILVFSSRLFVQWVRKNHQRPLTIEDYSRARAALDLVFVETMAIKRIFAPDDLDFVSRTGIPEVRRFFLKEREALALQWLRTTRKQIGHLMDLHLKMASYTYEPSPRFEFKLTVNYLYFIFASHVLLVFLWLRGPFEVARTVTYTFRATEYFCSVVGLRLESINPLKLGPTPESRMV